MVEIVIPHILFDSNVTICSTQIPSAPISGNCGMGLPCSLACVTRSIQPPPLPILYLPHFRPMRLSLSREGECKKGGGKLDEALGRNRLFRGSFRQAFAGRLKIWFGFSNQTMSNECWAECLNWDSQRIVARRNKKVTRWRNSNMFSSEFPCCLSHEFFLKLPKRPFTSKLLIADAQC